MTLTIITINYNDKNGLRMTAESIFRQSWQDYEWIIVDGGSTDGSAEYISSVSNKTSWWCSEKDSGVYNAMNKGISHAQGDYLLFLNSGDTLYEQDTLQKVFNKHIDADVLYGNALFDNGKHPFVFKYDEQLTAKSLYKYSLNHQSSFIKTTLLKEHGLYDERFAITADWKRFMEMFLSGCKFVYLPFVISRYDTHGISSVNQDKVRTERKQWIKELVPDYVSDVLDDWESFQNDQCIQTREFREKNRLFRRMIRSNLHLIRWLNKIL